MDLLCFFGDGNNFDDVLFVEDDEGVLFCSNFFCWEGVNFGIVVLVERINVNVF